MNILLVILAVLLSFGLFTLLSLTLHFPLLLAIGLSLAAYLGFTLLLKPIIRIGKVDVETLAGGNELKAILDEARADLREIGEISRKAPHGEIKEKTAHLALSGDKILDYLEKHPNKIREGRRFTSYYLNTARDILGKYMDLAASDYNSEKMSALYQSTSSAMDTLNAAFDRQFNNLVENDIIDIQTDIEVLKNTIDTEG